MPTNVLITQIEAAAILNRSVSSVSRAIKNGRLEYADPERRLIHRPGLEQRFARSTRPRADKPLARRLEVMDEPSRQESPLDEDWEEIARVANSYLDCKCWGPPPWTSQQWGVLAGVIDMACSGDG